MNTKNDQAYKDSIIKQIITLENLKRYHGLSLVSLKRLNNLNHELERLS